jgi:hypothetical protein
MVSLATTRTTPLIAIAFAAACQSNPGGWRGSGRVYTTSDSAVAAWVTITPTKSSYAAHEEVNLVVIYTNPTAERCCVSTRPDTTFTVISVTKNGYAITPRLVTITSCFQSLSNWIYSSYVPLDPGATVSAKLTAWSDHVLDTESISSSPGSQDDTLWSLTSGGNYEVKLHAFVPIMIRYPGTPCNIAWDPIAVDFALEGQG